MMKFSLPTVKTGFVLTFIAFIALVVNAQNCQAQQALKDSDKAVLAFDIRIDKAMAAQLAKDLKLKEQVLENSPMPSDQREVMSKLVRVFGAVGRPATLEDVMKLAIGGQVQPSEKMEMTEEDFREMQDNGSSDEQLEKSSPDKENIFGDGGNVSFQEEGFPEEGGFKPSPLPMNFFVQLIFEDEESVSKMHSEITEFEFTKEVMVGGKKMHAAENGVPNIVVYRPSPKVIEMGTTDYLGQANRKFFTPKLTEAWSKVPNEAVRIAFDVDGVRDLIVAGREMAGDQIPGPAVPIVDMIDHVTAIRASADLAAENLIQLSILGTDEEKTEQVRGTVDGLLGMAKFASQGSLGEIEREMPGAGKIAGEILKSLQATRIGTTVSVKIPKPDDFDQFVVEAVGKVRVAAQTATEMNDIRQIVLAVHNYESAFQRFPFSDNEKESSDLSWRVKLARFLESPIDADHTKAWDDEANKKFVDMMPGPFGSDSKTTGICRIDTGKAPKGFGSITNGSSNTIMVIKTDKKIPWMQNKDITVEEAMALYKALGGDETLIAGMYDGSVQRFGKSTSEEEFRKMLEWESK